MARFRLVSWNVNGIRAVVKKGFIDWLEHENADVVCLQEIKAREEQVPRELMEYQGYKKFFSSAERKGYSGVALFTRKKPINVQYGFGIPEFDREGRVIVADYRPFILFNIYFPNGKQSKERLDYKMAFYDAFLRVADGLREQGRSVVVCGDVNTAHKEIDLAHPKENSKTSGFLPEERAWINTFLDHGYIDTFREFNQDPDQYTWWDYKSFARERNVGWRIDYFYISDNMRHTLKKAFIEKEVMGSDHCPIGIEIAL